MFTFIKHLQKSQSRELRCYKFSIEGISEMANQKRVNLKMEKNMYWETDLSAVHKSGMKRRENLYTKFSWE
jgi:hypothetical protein